MIFVTVGTHEQQFDRLIKYVDELKGENKIEDEIIMQTGFCTYEPKNCKWKRLFPYQEMIKNVSNARIVITHGGPSSFIMPLQIGKVPIVVPRQKKYGEHVNDHQLEFCREVKERRGGIIVVEDIDELENIIVDYANQANKIAFQLTNNNNEFKRKFDNMVKHLFKD